MNTLYALVPGFDKNEILAIDIKYDSKQFPNLAVLKDFLESNNLKVRMCKGASKRYEPSPLDTSLVLEDFLLQARLLEEKSKELLKRARTR
ncbi:MAG: hypothetical protein AABX23_01170 [Nanoarchaeota archaeon]